jgi:cytochrome b subunit of formate dehydrogenase
MEITDPKLKEILLAELRQRLKTRGLSDSDLTEEQLGQMLIELSAGLERKADQIAEAIKPPTPEAPAPEKLSKVKEEQFLRLSLNLRLQHFVMLSSIVILIITGLPLKFHDAAISHVIITFFGGITNSAWIHRFGATGLIGVGLFHLLYTVFTVTGRRDFMLLLPKPQDLKDYVKQIKYFLGMTEEKAKFGRFSYIEKFDYWAVYWGMIIMIGSGLMLWFESFVMSFLPKFILDIAKEAHSDEAMLATLAIVIWHFYNVHLNPHKFPMSKTWITGKISKHEMMDEHSLEYEEILKTRTGDEAVKGGRS